MAKAIPDAAFDAALNYVAASTILHVCSAEPANYAGIAAVSLADVVVDSGDFTLANGDTSGRKVTVGAQTFNIDASGTATHVALALVSDTTLRAVTTITSQAVTAGNSATLGAFKWELADPT